MRAIVQKRYGSLDRLQLAEVPDPEPGPGQVRVRVKASSVHADVWHVVMGRPWILRVMGGGLLRPKNPIPGTDLAGVVDAVGEGVTALSVGDAVYGETVDGFQWQHGGCWAERCCVDAAALRPKPESLSFEQAASAPTSGYIAANAVLQEGQVEAGDVVLVNGAGGALGTVAVPACVALGATVVAVDLQEKAEMLQALGASEVVDYRTTDLSTLGRRFDAILDIASTLTLPKAAELLRGDGKHVLIGHDDYGRRGRAILGSIPLMLGRYLRHRGHPALPAMTGEFLPDRVDRLHGWLESGAVVPAVGRTFPLDQAREALAALTTGEVPGKIVLTMD